ncbi:effector-associated domain 2-containing protein [Saccharothrix texasensis]|uniref:Class 3 adenylate cyclase n=1 Tax=Saccharothrix texasensis TaxID=103734 RepID=A0A3N1H388_9PSEU|nr:hypothetical protein [Saccharothrix texasensis]ROP36960.1 class 3 adenylate cyclase [Saccharothrix texasensis]
MVRADDDDRRGLLVLVDALARIPSLADRAGRNLVIRMMSAELRETLMVEEHQAAIGHLFNLAEACLSSPERLAALIRVVSRFEPDSGAMAELRRVVAGLTPLDLFPTHERARLFTLPAGVVVPDIADIYRVVAGPTAPSLYGPTTYTEVFRVLETLNAGADGVPRPLVFVEHIAARVRTELAIELHRWTESQAVSMGLLPELTAVRDSLRPERAQPPTKPGSPAYLVLHLDRYAPTGDRYRLSYWWQRGGPTLWPPTHGEDAVGTLDEVREQVASLLEKEVHGDGHEETPDELNGGDAPEEAEEAEPEDTARPQDPAQDVETSTNRLPRTQGGTTDGARAKRSLSRPLRMGFVVDIVGYSGRTWRLRDVAQRRVSELADAVVDHLGLDAAAVDLQGTGDGVPAFLPAESDVSRVLSRLLPTWRDLLREDNALYTDRLRLRMAVTLGPVAPGPLGFAGDSATTLGRLVDSEVLRTEATASAEVDLVVLVSDTLHSLVVDPSDTAFTRHPVEVKGYRADAWLWVGRPPTG